ncbi:MAG TPA: PQQ-dependent sugar dehydrogenase, partial [Bryobacteraceae bacterium]|nr:PQQ-dependent sugar dehydrogenase [Bryobacteraceae bacterium]
MRTTRTSSTWWGSNGHLGRVAAARQFGLIAAALCFASGIWAQQPAIGIPPAPLAQGPFTFDTAEQHRIKVTVVARGLVHPWSVAFVPGGDMLVTERGGQVRIIRHGVLDPKPLTGIPKVNAVRNAGLFDIALHPRFAENSL